MTPYTAWHPWYVANAVHPMVWANPMAMLVEYDNMYTIIGTFPDYQGTPPEGPGYTLVNLLI